MMGVNSSEVSMPSEGEKGLRQARSSNDELSLQSEKKHGSHALNEAEQQILDRQLVTLSVSTSYWTLFRYATKTDLAIICISSICAIAAGAVMPLMTVSDSILLLIEYRLLSRI